MVYSPNLWVICTWVDGQSWIPWGTLQQFSFWLVVPNWSGTCERIQLSNYLRLTRTYSKPQRDWNSSIFALFCRGFTFFSRSTVCWCVKWKRIAAMISWIWICVERIVCQFCPMSWWSKWSPNSPTSARHDFWVPKLRELLALTGSWRRASWLDKTQ